jgi:dCTP deaminase
MQGILSDTAILAAVNNGDIEIDPFVPGHVNVTSYDLTLGPEVKVYKDWVLTDHPDERYFTPLNGILDSKKEPQVVEFKMDPVKGFVLRPGIGYLMHTQERIHTKRYNPTLDGKSSIGRLFLQIHATAGYGDPGFNGQYTLEVIVQHPVRVYPGMRICQIRFHTIAGELSKTYDQVGHYTNQHAKGAIPSQAWRQFQPKT